MPADAGQSARSEDALILGQTGECTWGRMKAEWFGGAAFAHKAFAPGHKKSRTANGSAFHKSLLLWP